MFIQPSSTFAHEVGQKNSSDHGVVGKARARLSALIEHAGEKRALRKAIEELQDLDDQALADIGITRQQIAAVVRSGRKAA